MMSCWDNPFESGDWILERDDDSSSCFRFVYIYIYIYIYI